MGIFNCYTRPTLRSLDNVVLVLWCRVCSKGEISGDQFWNTLLFGYTDITLWVIYVLIWLMGGIFEGREGRLMQLFEYVICVFV